ncbi:hypothetical protein IFO69_20210 [Echinicola sp. CAU 1574]|uniref:Uncharacterized protein n=1 Tax=Echinicola arenosa TaxID=2774144 RepID=A0ABR9AU20_9BACT|nr:hypothetical protein [Echinicola arenosa]MBD8491089.1 hypothetical protein [Echinicola arenosa]
MAKEKKLSIKHFYGEDLKKIKKNPINLSPLYVQITYNRKPVKLKSFSWTASENLIRIEESSGVKLGIAVKSAILNNNISYDGHIKRDLWIINESKTLHDKFYSTEFDISFFSSEVFHKVITPCHEFVYQDIKDQLLDYFSKQGSSTSTVFVESLPPKAVYLFLSTMRENSSELFNDIIKHKDLDLLYSLSTSFEFHSSFNDNFLFLFDIYNEQKINSLFPLSPKSDKKNKRDKVFKMFEGKIEAIFQNK